MTWPVPAPGEIADRAASTYESTPGLAGIDARSENSLAGVSTRVTEGATFDLYLFQANCAQELMPDTAQAWLSRHANIWGVPRLQAAGSSGTATFLGAPGTVIPAALQATAPSGVLIATSAPVTIPAGGSVSVPMVGMASDGPASNLPGGTVLTLVSPLAGLSAQGATIDAGCLSGGTLIEDIEAWRARILQRIRNPPMGGSQADYLVWAQDALDTVADVQVVGNATGLGTVGIWIAMAGPRVPTSAEIALVQSYIGTVRPVTAAVTVNAATLTPVNFTLHLSPDTPAIRTAVMSALALAFANDGAVGATGYYSRWDAAISSAAGEYSFERTAPSADVAGAIGVQLTLGAIIWV